MFAIVVGAKHADEQAFAETTWTCKENATRLLFQDRQVHGLVHIIHVACHDINEIGYAVRDLFCFFVHHTQFGLFRLQTYSFFLEKANLLVCKADRKIFLPYFFAEC